MASGDDAASSSDSEPVAHTFRVLLVCRANVCRSPTAMLLLLRHARHEEAIASTASAAASDAGRPAVSRSLTAHLVAGTAGDGAVPGQGWCPVAAGRVERGPDRDDLLASHRARALAPEMVLDSDLILTAARAQRASVVRLGPAASTRTFTLTEAAHLANVVRLAVTASRGPGTAIPKELVTAASAVEGLPHLVAPVDALRWLTAEMHNLRGMVAPPGKGRSFPTLSRRHSAKVDPFDIADPHGPAKAKHHVGEIDDAVRSWVAAAAVVVRSSGDP